MGRLVKNHWARLLVLVAAAIQIGGSIMGFFWPKVTWDFSTAALNFLVEPVPVLQSINLVLGILVVAWEWPFSPIAGKMYHRSIHARLVAYTICTLFALFLYQSHNSAFYYTLGIYGYLLALSENEIIYPEPWKAACTDDVTSAKLKVDCEQDTESHFAQNFEHGQQGDTDQGYSHSSAYYQSLTPATSNQSLESKPSIRFNIPSVPEKLLLSDASGKRDSRRPRMRSNTWHPETPIEYGVGFR